MNNNHIGHLRHILFIVFLSYLCYIQTQVFGQHKGQILTKKEIEFFDDATHFLNTLRHKTDTAIIPKDRFEADSLFILKLKKALLTKKSFYYAFKELEGVSVLEVPDGKFKIFTWQYTYDKMRYFHHGVIQLAPKKKHIPSTLIPLIDQSNYIKDKNNQILNPKTWIGCVYYDCKKYTTKNKEYYILFGFDAYNVRSNKKWLEVLTIEKNKAQFGAPIFHLFDSSQKKEIVQNRFSIEFQDYSTSVLKYDPELDIIIFDRLISLSEEVRDYTFTITGQYDAFKWDGNKFNYIKEVFHRDGSVNPLVNPPLPLEATITEDGVNFDPKFIKKQNAKNKKTKVHIP